MVRRKAKSEGGVVSRHGNSLSTGGPTERTYRLRLNGKDVLLVGTVLGLTSEKGWLAHLFRTFKPRCIALGVSVEGLRGLKAVAEGSVKYTTLSPLEEIYARKLSAFGEVQVPPPAYVTLYRLGKAKGTKIMPIDIPEMEYTKLYTSKVGYLELLKISRITKRARKMDFRCRGPAEFVLEWDRYVNSTPGIRAVEVAREDHMARRIRQITRNLDFPSVMAVVEYQRYQGVKKPLIP